MLELLIIFIVGSVVGSFLNVCIYRMPLEQSIIQPRSYCPGCKKPIPWYDNIPLLSYVLLKGRCRFCKKRISFRYFIVETVTGLLSIFLFKHYRLSFDFIFYFIFCCGLIIATFVDLKHRVIPEQITLGGIILGILLNISKGFFSHSFLPIKNSLLGLFIGAGIIYFTKISFDFVFFKLLKKPPIDGERESMGFGDVEFLAMIGAFLGWQKVLLTFFIAPYLGIIFGVINFYFNKKHTLPYAPFLSLASFISMWKGEDIIYFFLLKI